ncbi:MAG: site-specific integrase [bacterium]|nr:site-specific integrase [bacterium]
MLTKYFKSSLTIERYRSDSIGLNLDDFIFWLEACGYSRRSIRRHVREVVHFAAWAETAELPVHALDRNALTQFHNHLASEQLLRYVSGGYQHVYQSACVLITFLETTGQVRPAASCMTTSSPTDILWSEFSEWMRSHRGTMDSTLANYHLPIVALLEALGTSPSTFTAKGLRDFLLQQAKHSSVTKAKNIATAVRMFLRFLIARDECTIGLEHAIPTVAHWRLASIPKYLPAKEVECLIASCDQTLAIGARDRAILLLIARLGLRASDISGLKFSNLDWHNGTLVVSGKNRRETRLPIPQDVGDAILHYMEHGRPRISSDHIFITTTAPLVPISRVVVGRAVRRALLRTNIVAPMQGAHLLRHSAATSLLSDGVSLPAISALLRHASIDTTRVYAKVDVGLLNEIAIAWPEVSSC